MDVGETSGGGDADEGDFIELLIASERVDGWLEGIKHHSEDLPRLRQLVGELAAAVRDKEAYAEEARQAGAAAALTSLMKRPGTRDDEELLEQISAALAALSGPAASGDRLRWLRYGPHDVGVKEGALGDGVGAKVWQSAHALCRELLANPGMVAGKAVLEIGAGCGACGLLAARLGAQSVVLSDYVDQLLLNLREAIHINFPPDRPKLERAHSGVDPGCEESSTSAAAPSAADAAAWELGNVSVRFVDWFDSVNYLAAQQPGEDAGACSKTAVDENRDRGGELDGPSTCSVAPQLPDAQQFDVVLGTEVLYEWPMAVWVPAAVAHRLNPGGRALIYMAVRDQAMYEEMLRNMRRRGLRVGTRPFAPQERDGGLAGREADYEGGFRIVAAEHAAAPAGDWHRNDLFDAS